MNRAQRRAAKKQQPKWQRMTHDQKLAALVKNGITQKDLDSAYEDGRTGSGISWIALPAPMPCRPSISAWC